MSSETAFLNAILEQPEDDGVRLVFADWLSDQDNPRGEFLRCQMKRSQWVADLGQRELLHQRERELLADHGAAWLGRLPYYCRECRFERGLVRATMEARRFVTHTFHRAAPALFKQTWLETLRLERTGKHFADLAASPLLALIGGLDLRGNGLDDEAIGLLACSPHLDRLTRLDLANNRLTGGALLHLKDTPGLGRLRWLDLRNSQLSPTASHAFRALLDSPLGQRLTWLDVSGNDLDEAADRAYADWRRERQKHHPNRLRNALGMELVRVPAGSFLMGSPDEEEGRLPHEGPRHEVEISRPFWLGVCHVTQNQYQRLMSLNPSHFQGSVTGVGVNPRWLPVDSVAPGDCRGFCIRLSDLPEERKAGRVYRLPTEAEWEHACRAGAPSDWPFAFGTALSSRQANFRGSEPYGTAPTGARLERSTPGGSYDANAFGLFDMHGNMWDWVNDFYDPDYFTNSPRCDPSGPGEDSRSVLKGGSWYNAGFWCRSASRYGSTNDSGSYCISFRVAADGP